MKKVYESSIRDKIHTVGYKKSKEFVDREIHKIQDSQKSKKRGILSNNQ